MNQDSVDQRAYALWEKAGRPEGAHEEHWHQASRELAAEEKPADGAVLPGEKATPEPTPASEASAKA